MLVENAKPLLIVWLPMTAFGLSSETISKINGKLYRSESMKIGDSWLDDTLDFVLSRTVENERVLGHIPIPFYFYERLSNEKDAGADTTGFLLDSVSEHINISYPESPTADTPGSTKASVLTVRNTIDVNFRVKLDSTIVSVLRFLLKRVLTNKNTAKNIRFSFFWNEYVLSYCKMVDYDEEPITGSDLTLLKLKLDTFNYLTTEDEAKNATALFAAPEVDYTLPEEML